MIDELKQLLTMVQNLPDMVLHVLLGFAVYKLIMWLSSVGAAVTLTKFAITKWHDWATREKKIRTEFSYNSIVLGDAAKVKLDMLVSRLHTLKEDVRPTNMMRLNYERWVYDEEIVFALAAIEEKLKRHKEEKAASA